jgi:hypothetical protein
MKRGNQVSNKSQRKISRNTDRAVGRVGIKAANQKSAKSKQHGDDRQHQLDAVHLKMNKKTVKKSAAQQVDQI